MHPSPSDGKSLLFLGAPTEVAPTFDALYYSFYLEGLRRLRPRRRFRFTTSGFPQLGHHGLALQLEGSRVFISASDGPGLAPAALAWADVVGKVNLDQFTQPESIRGRIVALGPSFPVRVWGPIAALATALKTYVAGAWRTTRSLKQHFAPYRRQYRYRLPETSYVHRASDESYIFSLSRLWLNEPTTNRWRADFLRAAQQVPGLTFEGGFLSRKESELAEFGPLFCERKLELADWISKTNRSAIVFNTPAVRGCHGWKLAEYLALGKAIITSPPIRALPAPLEHGRHVHVVQDVGELNSAIEVLLRDGDYRRTLEKNARTYYEKWLAPEVVLRRIITPLSRNSCEYGDATS